MNNDENMVELKCFRLLEDGISQDATDIHLVPKMKGYDVLFKVGVKLRRSATIPEQLAGRMISFFKFLSSLDISDRRKPQSGSFHKRFSDDNYSFRVSTIPSFHMKESVVIRLQKHDRIVPLNELCLDARWAEQLRRAVAQPQGLLMATGPTGSGKTTTIYSLTAHCVNELDRHVITLEDPVENDQSHLLQIQVNERSGMTYAAGLKAILRHSPDVIMIGEIRDAETAKTAVQAALTGHLVITSVHAKNPVGCFYRMADFGVTMEELRQTVICVSAQRLIPRENGSLGAVFEILDGGLLEKVKHDLSNGEHVELPKNLSLESAMRKYSLVKTL